MGKFKVCQYVRVLHTDFPQIKVGDAVEVVDVLAGGVRLKADGFSKGLTFFNSEVEAWQPKAGERVKIVAPEVVYHWNELWAEKTGVHVEIGDLVYVTKVTPRYVDGKDGVTIAVTSSGNGPRWTIDRFAPVDTATLIIEAGKFYKTRDGRKVGPMKRDGEAWTPNSGVHWYLGDGRRYFEIDRGGPTDIIAEWVDEPIAQPAAQPAKASNDNAAPAKPKFKVGDRVVYVGKSKRISTKHRMGWQGKIKSIGVEAAEVDYDNGEWGKQYFDNLELIVPAPSAIVALIENGTAKPSTRPKVHADQASATTEAERLALQFPGQQFGVFVLADSKIADLVDVPTAVLRAA